MTDRAKPDEKGLKDLAHAVGKAVISSIPMAGGPAVVLFEQVFRDPLERRRDQWIGLLTDAVEELKEKIDTITYETLSNDEMFITAAMQAAQIAQRNHHEEKLEALRNAVQNSALPHSPDDSLQLMFLRFVDELTPWHLRILRFFDAPKGHLPDGGHDFLNGLGGSVSSALERACPELRGRRGFYDLIVEELQARGLLSQGSFMHGMMTGSGVVASRTTDLGKEFISYISSPFD